MSFANARRLILLLQGGANQSASQVSRHQDKYFPATFRLKSQLLETAAESYLHHPLENFALRPHRYRRHGWNHTLHSTSEETLQQAPLTHASIRSWVVLAMMLQFFAGVYYVIIQSWPSHTRYHSAVILFWVLAAALHVLVIWRIDDQDPVQWLTGYLIEIIGSVENIFVFHIIIKAFRVPRSGAQQTLFIVVCCQIAYQFVLFMGFGRELQMMWFLPFCLGPWLIYCGYHAAHADEQEELTFNNFAAFRICKACLGDRLDNACNGGAFFSMGRDGRLRCTLLLPALLCLVSADFFLELDTTLVKMEELANDFSGFSSSAFAAFAVPEFYFLARDVFQRYPTLKLGVAFSLALFGADMLVSNFLTIPPLTSCLMVFLIFLAIIVWSKIMEFLFPGIGYVCTGKTDSFDSIQDSEMGYSVRAKVYGTAVHARVYGTTA
mmetsp:Transcript_96360/g.152364  ORF Transcript_96360/g.152364 Transcript_96360/m.152364 type:complete len:437 (+) Transcript_96360:53-1363(+)